MVLRAADLEHGPTPAFVVDDEEGSVDGHELGAWSALTCLLLVLGLVQFDFARRRLAGLGEWLLHEVTAEAETDQDALDLYRALRRQRLSEHVARLRRILADDAHQSAVRQIGNRLAYGQLLRELAEIGETPRSLPLDAVSGPTWTPAVAAAGRGAADADPRGAGRYAPRVEVLDFGRPRGRS